MTRFRMTVLILVHIVAVIAIRAAILYSEVARTDRNWEPKFEKQARFERTGDRLRLVNGRAFTFLPGGAEQAQWFDQSYDPENLVRIWYFVEPFSGSPVFAHSFVSFVFEGPDGRKVLSMSVEARKEKGEDYSPIKGLFREYELSYVWSTEKDILTRIAVSLDHKLYAYEMNVPPAQARQIFMHFVERTNALAGEPRFYNTIFSNCTNELAKAVNDAYPKALPWRWSWVFTGWSGRWLYDLGFVVSSNAENFKALQKHSDIQPIVKDVANLSADEFAIAWRQKFSR